MLSMLFKQELDRIRNFSILGIIPAQELCHAYMVGVDSIAIFMGIMNYRRIPMHGLINDS
jgi:hypothetical protein